MNREKCVVLVPVGGVIDPQCERSLHGLERRGYRVLRVQGFSAIDYGRSVLACDALADGFDELMWIDSDIVFHPDSVEQIRGHGKPFVCGIYAKKSQPEFACDFLPGTPKITFGPEGGLHEIRYAGFGFVHVRRSVFETIRSKLSLPECNKRFGKRIHPYFLPMVVPDGAGNWYLPEDYAFCERARQCGIRILADTTIRLWHVGSYGYTWEDVNPKKSRLTGFALSIGPPRTENPTDSIPQDDLAAGNGTTAPYDDTSPNPP
jgi:hypothetical protein